MAELELSPEAQKLMTARQNAIAELKQIDGRERSVGDHDVIRVSGARMLLDSLSMRMLSGEAVSPTDLAQANDMVDQALQAAGKRSIRVQFETTPSITACPECGWSKPLYGEVLSRSQPNETGRDETGREFFERMRREREAREIEIDGEIVEAGVTAPERLDASLPVSVASSPMQKPERPAHELIVRDTPPNALPTNSGSLCWTGTAGNRGM